MLVKSSTLHRENLEYISLKEYKLSDEQFLDIVEGGEHHNTPYIYYLSFCPETY